MKKIRLIDKPLPRINDTSKTLPRISPAELAAALGAEPKSVPLGETFGPFLLADIREALKQFPPAAHTDPTKVHIDDKDWAELERLAGTLATPEYRPSAGDLAKVLIRLSLRSLAGEVAADSPVRRELGTLAKPG